MCCGCVEHILRPSNIDLPCLPLQLSAEPVGKSWHDACGVNNDIRLYCLECLVDFVGSGDVDLHACDLLWKAVWGSRRTAVNNGDGAAGMLLYQRSHYGRPNKASGPRDQHLFRSHNVGAHGVAGCGGEMVRDTRTCSGHLLAGRKLYVVTAQVSTTLVTRASYVI